MDGWIAVVLLAGLGLVGVGISAWVTVRAVKSATDTAASAVRLAGESAAESARFMRETWSETLERALATSDMQLEVSRGRVERERAAKETNNNVYHHGPRAETLADNNDQPDMIVPSIPRF